MKLLVRDGLVVREVAPRETWNAILGDATDRAMNCYWNAATMVADKAAVEAWHAAADGIRGKFIASMASAAMNQVAVPAAPQLIGPAVPKVERLR